MCRAVRRELTQDWKFSCFSLPRYNIPCWLFIPNHATKSTWDFTETVLACGRTSRFSSADLRRVCSALHHFHPLLSSAIPLRQMLRPQSSPRCALDLHQRVVFQSMRRDLHRFSDHLKSFFSSTKMMRTLGFLVHSAGGQRTSDYVAEISFQLVFRCERNQLLWTVSYTCKIS